MEAWAFSSKFGKKVCDRPGHKGTQRHIKAWTFWATRYARITDSNKRLLEQQYRLCDIDADWSLLINRHVSWKEDACLGSLVNILIADNIFSQTFHKSVLNKTKKYINILDSLDVAHKYQV